MLYMFSFSAVLRAYWVGQLTLAEIRNAIIYVGCSTDHIFGAFRSEYQHWLPAEVAHLLSPGDYKSREEFIGCMNLIDVAKRFSGTISMFPPEYVPVEVLGKWTQLKEALHRSTIISYHYEEDVPSQEFAAMGMVDHQNRNAIIWRDGLVTEKKRLAYRHSYYKWTQRASNAFPHTRAYYRDVSCPDTPCAYTWCNNNEEE